MYILFFFNKLHGVSRVAVSEFSDVIKNSGYLNPSTLSFLVHWLFTFMLVSKFHGNDDSDGGKGHAVYFSNFSGKTWINRLEVRI